MAESLIEIKCAEAIYEKVTKLKGVAAKNALYGEILQFFQVERRVDTVLIYIENGVETDVTLKLEARGNMKLGYYELRNVDPKTTNRSHSISSHTHTPRNGANFGVIAREGGDSALSGKKFILNPDGSKTGIKMRISHIIPRKIGEKYLNGTATDMEKYFCEILKDKNFYEKLSNRSVNPLDSKRNVLYLTEIEEKEFDLGHWFIEPKNFIAILKNELSSSELAEFHKKELTCGENKNPDNGICQESCSYHMVNVAGMTI